MQSPPAEGSSKTTGGFARGHAAGNVFNFADAESTNIAPFISGIKGTVLVYSSSQNPANLKLANLQPMTKTQVQVNTNLGPILEGVSKRYSPIQSMFDYFNSDNL